MAWRGTYLFKSVDEAEYLWEVPELWRHHVLRQAWFLAYPSMDVYEDFAIGVIGDGLAPESFLNMNMHLDDLVHVVWQWHPLHMVVIAPEDVFPGSVDGFMNYGDPKWLEVKESEHGGVALYIERARPSKYLWGWAHDIIIPFESSIRFFGSPLQSHAGPYNDKEPSMGWGLGRAFLRLAVTDELIRRTWGVPSYDPPEYIRDSLVRGEARVSQLIRANDSSLLELVRDMHERSEEQ